MKLSWLLGLLLVLSLITNIVLINRLKLFNPKEILRASNSEVQQRLPSVSNNLHSEVSSPPAMAQPKTTQIIQNPEVTYTHDKRDDLLKQAKQWLDEENIGQLQLFLRNYLQQHPLDMDFLILEAELNVKTELLSDAIAYFYSLKRLPMEPKQSQVINERIIQLSRMTIDQLQDAYSWDTLAIFVEPLLQLEPENRTYILALAEAYAQQQQLNLMESILATLDYDDPDAMNIRQLAKLEKPQSTEEISEQQDTPTLANARTAIKLTQVGDQYIVTGQLSGNTVELLIDTGASITAISNQYFRTTVLRQKFNFIGRFSVNTAGGKVLAPMYQFDELKLNHAVVKNISVVVLPMHNIDNANGLLGMNFLREFDFKIDQRRSRLLLSSHIIH